MGHSFIARGTKTYFDVVKLIRIGVMTQTLWLRITLYKFKVCRAKGSRETSSANVHDLILS